MLYRRDALKNASRLGVGRASSSDIVFGFSVLWSAEYIYLTTNIAQTITAQHTINTGSAQPPFVLHSNNQNQKVIGLIGELPDHATAHNTGGDDDIGGNLDATARTGISKNSGSDVGARRSVNLIEGANITLTIADDSGNEEVDVTIAGAAIGGYAAVQEEGSGVQGDRDRPGPRGAALPVDRRPRWRW